MRNSRVDELVKINAEKEAKEKKEIENIRLACKDIFNSTNGKYFLQFLKKICGWNDSGNNINSEILIYQKGRRDIWNVIRNILPKEILVDVEIYEEYRN